MCTCHGDEFLTCKENKRHQTELNLETFKWALEILRISNRAVKIA